MTKLVARLDRATGDYNLFVDNMQVPFGRLANCEVCHVFVSDDEELAGYIAHRIEGDMSLREMLVEVRKGYEAFDKDQTSVSKAETWAENAWLRHAERFDPEAQADLELHNSLHPYGYC